MIPTLAQAARSVLFVSVVGSLSILAIPARAAGPTVLSDSTTADEWTLANGMKVTVRNVPGSRGVAVVLCYRTGSAQDPPGREGLASLLAEVFYRGATADVPERSRDELLTLRPLGWNLKITPYLTTLAEIALPNQFPGVLHQVASRARGVTVTEGHLKSVTETVKGELAANYGRLPESALYHDLRALAAGLSPASLSRYANGKGLDGLSVREVQERLQSTFVPANAALSIAGDLARYDLHRLIDREFGPIPGGKALPSPPAADTLRGGDFRVTLPGLAATAGGLGIIGPALTDTLHPSFALHAMLIGSFCKMRMGPPAPPLEARFEYSVLDDPEVVRIYPPVSPDPNDQVPVAEEFRYTLGEIPPEVELSNYQEVLDNVAWLLGGPLPRKLATRMRREAGALYTLASGMAARAQWGDEDFWALYRRRFEESAARDLSQWRRYFGAKDHLVQLRLLPEKTSGAAR